MEYKDHILNEVIRQLFLQSRHKRGLTQNGLSSLSNITRQFISQVEGGKRQPSISTLSALANAYKRSLSDFFREVDRIYPLIETGHFVLNEDIPLADSTQKAQDYIYNTKKKQPL